MREVMNKLKENEYTDDKFRKVLVMHFSGPTGVGKTLLADTLAKALFTQVDEHQEPCGGLKLIMKYSLSVLPKGKMYETQEKELLEPIVRQLEACPRSLILIDDIHWLNPGFLDCLKPALRGEKLRSGTLNKSVDTRQAIFILSSDLESEQRTKFSYEYDQEDAKKEIRKLANARWGTDKHGGPADITRWVPVIPFLMLSKDDMIDMAKAAFRELEGIFRRYFDVYAAGQELDYGINWIGQLHWKKFTLRRLAEAEDLIDPALGGRGMNSFIINEHGSRVLQRLSQELVALSRQGHVFCTTNIFGHKTCTVTNNIITWLGTNGKLMFEIERDSHGEGHNRHSEL